MNQFHSDLAVGKIIENNVLDMIKKKYPKAHILEGKHKGWDIYVPETDTAIEVKGDQKSKYTGNIVIEISFDGKPSALSTTLADLWVIYDGYNYNWFTPDDIRRCIKENDLKAVVFTGRGDTKSKEAYLIKKEILYKYKKK